MFKRSKPKPQTTEAAVLASLMAATTAMLAQAR